jgi:hypothetical protein
MVNKPNLFIPGAAKSGTSSLHNYLNLHPDIFMSKVKEPHYFSHESKYKNPEGKREYYSLFKEAENFKYKGESSTGYMVFSESLQRIKSDIINPKFIFILRNPIDRVYSHYWWLRGMGYEAKDFKEAFLYDKDQIPTPESKEGMGYKKYYYWGLYGKHLKRYYDIFSSSDIFIITTRSLKSDPLSTLNRCFNFLDVKKLDSLSDIETNKTILLNNPKLYQKIKGILLPGNLLNNYLGGIHKKVLSKRTRNYIFDKLNIILDKFTKINSKEKKYPPLSKEDRKWVANFYYEDIKLLKQITGRQFSEWEDFNHIK